MTRMFWFRLAPRLAMPLAVVVLLSARDAAAQQQRGRSSSSGYESRIDTTFAFDKNGAVNLSAASGDIIVTGWPRNEIRVRAVSEDDNIRLTGSSARVTLEVAGRRRSDTRFELSVPYGVRVNAQTLSGDIRVRGTRGPVEAHAQNGDIDIDGVSVRLDVTTLNGDVTVRGVSGDATVNSLNGELRLSDVTGNVDASTVSGDIDLRGVAAKLVRAKTTSGEVTFDGTIDPAGRYELNSHSGDIKLRIPRETSAQLTVSTWSGTIDSSFPITLRPGELGIGGTKAKRYVFEIGGGGARITVEAFSGDITISSSGRGGSER